MMAEKIRIVVEGTTPMGQHKLRGSALSRNTFKFICLTLFGHWSQGKALDHFTTL